MDTDKHVFTRKVYSFVIKKKLIYLWKPILITIIHLFLLKGSLSDTSAIQEFSRPNCQKTPAILKTCRSRK